MADDIIYPETRDHIVYLYFDIYGIPFYVGEGIPSRPYRHRRLYSHLGNALRKYKALMPLVVLNDGLTDAEAKVIECALIRAIGRRDLGTGPLINRTDGGEGTPGSRRTEEFRKKCSDRMTSPDMREKLQAGLAAMSVEAIEERSQKQRQAKLGKPLAREHAAKIGAAHLGRKRPPEVGAKITAAKLGKKWSEDRKAILRAANRSRDPDVRERIRQGTVAYYEAKGIQMPDPALVTSLYKSGKSINAIADEIGSKPGRVYKVLRASDVQMRPRRVAVESTA